MVKPPWITIIDIDCNNLHESPLLTIIDGSSTAEQNQDLIICNLRRHLAIFAAIVWSCVVICVLFDQTIGLPCFIWSKPFWSW